MKKLLLVLVVVVLASFLFVGCFMEPEPVPEDLIVEEEESVVVNQEIHKIEIEMFGKIPVLIGESILLMVHAYNYPDMQEVRFDTSDKITWAENCDEDVLEPLEGFSTIFTAKEAGKYQVSACYEYPKVDGCLPQEDLCTPITIYVVEE